MMTEDAMLSTSRLPRQAGVGIVLRAGKPSRLLMGFGMVLLAYAVLGNYVALPGYRRFIEGGDGQEAGQLAYVWGATKTVLWMFSFQLGAFCLSYAALQACGDSARRFRALFAAGVLLWMVFWAVPDLPGPFRWYFAAIGLVVLCATILVFLALAGAAAAPSDADALQKRRTWRIASYFFFAVATWETCGLGSVGGILRPDEALNVGSHRLVISQTSKLILELLLAWILALTAETPFGRRRAAP